MRNYKYKNKNNSDKATKTNDPSTRIRDKQFKGSIPIPEHVENQSLLFNRKAFKGLQNVGVIELKADPNSAVVRGSYPYPIIAATNRVIDANYTGLNNIDGNILTRIQNSVNSGLLNSFDLVNINFRINYLFMCYQISATSGHNNLAVNIEMLKSVQEAMSTGYSTMLTQLPFSTDTMETDLPIPTSLDDSTKAVYHKMGTLIHYQTVIQNAVAPLSKYIQTISLRDHVMDMSYRREAPLITELYGLLQKKAFIATLNAIGTSIIGEYFDRDWYKQTNMLGYVASRKSNSMTDPLLTACLTTAIPSCKITASGDNTPYYDSDVVLKSASGIYYNPDTNKFDGTSSEPISLTFEDIIYRLLRMLDVSSILQWARSFNTNPNEAVIKSSSEYYQNINKLVAQANNILARFTTSFSDVRTFLDKLSQSNLTYWRKGCVIDISQINSADPTYNVILPNMIAAYIGGSSEVTYDSSTQRWQASTMWNKYTGIPEFDRISGGSFLTFGLRKINQGSLSNEDIAMCLPVLFANELRPGYNKCNIINRLGLRIQVTSNEISTVNNNSMYARLDPLKVGFKVKVPQVDLTSLEGSLDEKKRLASYISALLANLIGYGDVKVASNNITSTLDPDYLCFLDLQIEDVSNEMIQYARNFSPFRVNTPDGRRTIGFGK